MTGTTGTGVAGEYFNVSSLDTSTNCGALGAGVTKCSFLDGSGSPTPSSWRNEAPGMAVWYVPEPAALALLGGGLVALGLLRLRRRDEGT